MLEGQEFEEYCLFILEMHFGQLANGILTKVKTRKDLNNTSNISDFKEFIDIMEINISVLAGKNKANEISNTLRSKIIGHEEIHIKSGCNVNNDVRVKNRISGNRINDEINEFLTRFQKPTKKDIDDFIKYIQLSKLVIKEDELRDEIEKERLYRKFHGPQDAIKTSEINELVNLLKDTDSKDIPNRKSRKQDLTYLIRDEPEVPDESVSEMVELMIPSEKDTKETLEDLGFEHLIVNNSAKSAIHRIPIKKSSGLKSKKFHIGNSGKI